MHCEMADFKHLCWKTITAPLNMSGCVCAVLASIQLWAMRSFSKGAGSSKRTVHGSDAADVDLWGELAPAPRPHFKAVLGSNCSWLWCSRGFAPFASQSCSCPDYFTVMNIENYKKQLEKFLCLTKWICIFMGTDVEFLDASCCILG